MSPIYTRGANMIDVRRHTDCGDKRRLERIVCVSKEDTSFSYTAIAYK